MVRLLHDHLEHNCLPGLARPPHQHNEKFKSSTDPDFHAFLRLGYLRVDRGPLSPLRELQVLWHSRHANLLWSQFLLLPSPECHSKCRQ